VTAAGFVAYGFYQIIHARYLHIRLKRRPMERLLTRDQSEASDLIERCLNTEHPMVLDLPLKRTAALQKQVNILH
jgi:hypothetical protein